MKKILLIEDDVFLAKIYKTFLEKSGHTVSVLYNGEKALETAKSTHPDVIVLDILMPKKDGFTVLTELKAEVATKNIPVYIVSSLESQTDIDKVLALGATKHIGKSQNSFRDVVRLIDEAIT